MAKESNDPSGDPILFSNSIRLTGRQWLGLAAITVLVVTCSSPLWKSVEPFDPPLDYRLPKDLSEDYWLFERFADLAAAKYDTVVVGDSVVWGEYVRPQETLSHYLNVMDVSRNGQRGFANLGLDGAFPLALAGLIEHHASSVRHQRVIVVCNPLWLSSRKADLSCEVRDDDAEPINHSNLIPQFVPWIPAYKADVETRLGVLVEQRSTFRNWTTHVQLAYYKSDIPGWILEHPYANPFEPLTHNLPTSDDKLWHLQQPWERAGVSVTDYAWIDLDTSLQWHAFQRLIGVLQQRQNRVFVVVGPFNEHLLPAASLQRYQKVKGTITAWLTSQQIPHLVPEALPSEEYGDSSHPLPKGYERLAEQLLADPDFARLAATR